MKPSGDSFRLLKIDPYHLYVDLHLRQTAITVVSKSFHLLSSFRVRKSDHAILHGNPKGGQSLLRRLKLSEWSTVCNIVHFRPNSKIAGVWLLDRKLANLTHWSISTWGALENDSSKVPRCLIDRQDIRNLDTLVNTLIFGALENESLKVFEMSYSQMNSGFDCCIRPWTRVYRLASPTYVR
jgi:hypothetical protein